MAPPPKRRAAPVDPPPDAEARRRLGVYVAPPAGSTLGDLAARWLGRHLDAAPVPLPAETPFTPEQLADLTAEPRLYGFHATLKAPFHLAEAVEPCTIGAAVDDLAVRLDPVVLPPLVPGLVRGCAVLVPSSVPEALLELERSCVVELDRFRRPLDELVLARRRRADLTERQDELLLAYGYPWVLDEFQFHMTLTRRLDATEAGPVLDAITEWFAPALEVDVAIDDLCLVEQAAPGEPFAVASRHRLGGPRRGTQG
jgi:hypothetical protein